MNIIELLQKPLVDIPKDKTYPTDSVQCDGCGGKGCVSCDYRGWFAPKTHIGGRLCEYDECGQPLTPDNPTLYCGANCANADKA